MDPTTLLTSVFAYVLPLLPAQWAAGASVLGSFVVSTCALVAFFWARHPPKAGTKAYVLYSLIGKLGLKGNHVAKAEVETKSAS